MCQSSFPVHHFSNALLRPQRYIQLVQELAMMPWISMLNQLPMFIIETSCNVWAHYIFVVVPLDSSRSGSGRISYSKGYLPYSPQPTVNQHRYRSCFHIPWRLFSSCNRSPAGGKGTALDALGIMLSSTRLVPWLEHLLPTTGRSSACSL